MNAQILLRILLAIIEHEGYTGFNESALSKAAWESYWSGRITTELFYTNYVAYSMDSLVSYQNLTDKDKLFWEYLHHVIGEVAR